MTTVPKLLPKETRDSIAKMLVDVPFRELCRVVSAKADVKHIEALNDETAGVEAGTNRSISAVQAIKDAAEYRTFLKVAAEMAAIASTDRAFSVIEIHPTTSTNQTP